MDLIALTVNVEEFHALEQLVSARLQQLDDIEKSGGYENKTEKRVLKQWQDEIDRAREKNEKVLK